MIRATIFSLVGLTFLVTGCQEPSKPTRTTCNPITHVLAADGKTCVGKPVDDAPVSCNWDVERRSADGTSCIPRPVEDSDLLPEDVDKDEKESVDEKKDDEDKTPVEGGTDDGDKTPVEGGTDDGDKTPAVGETATSIVLTNSQSTFLVDPSGRANCFSKDLQIPQGLKVELSATEAGQPDSPNQMAVVIKSTATGCNLTRAFLFKNHWTGWPASE